MSVLLWVPAEFRGRGCQLSSGAGGGGSAEGCVLAMGHASKLFLLDAH